MTIVQNVHWNISVWNVRIWQEINKNSFPFGVYAKGAFIFCILDRRHAKCVIGFSPFFLVTQIADESQTSTGLSVYVDFGLHKVPTMAVTVSKKQFCNVPIDFMLYFVQINNKICKLLMLTKTISWFCLCYCFVFLSFCNNIPNRDWKVKNSPLHYRYQDKLLLFIHREHD